MSFYEVIEDVTADAGIRVKAKTLQELLCKVILATFNEITNIDKVQRRESYTIEVSSKMPYLLADIINEALVLHEAKNFVASDCQVLELSDGHAKLKLSGDKFDAEKNEPKLVIKAATYHRLKVEKNPDGYVAEVIFDI
ncbi:MAG: archease [Hydrogenobacter sp.]|uniref:archease n=1 Tax=Hydrogenobacter thermophilus TaxID=940 RepID=UPI0030FBACD2